MQIFPFPTTAVAVAVEVTLVADEIAFHSFHSGSHDSIGEIVYAFEVITVIEACCNRRIAAAIDDQVAFDLSIFGFLFCIDGGDEMIVWRQPVHRCRDGVKFHVRRRAHEFVRILLVNHAPGVERNNLDREKAWLKRRLMDDLLDPKQ